jgi:hypothetical protein
VIVRPVSAANEASSIFQARTRYRLEPVGLEYSMQGS